MSGSMELAASAALVGVAALSPSTDASFALAMAGSILLGIGLAKSYDLSSESSDDSDPVEFDPSKGAGYIPTEEGGSEAQAEAHLERYRERVENCDERW